MSKNISNYYHQAEQFEFNFSAKSGGNTKFCIADPLEQSTDHGFPKPKNKKYHSIWNHKYDSLLVSKELRDFVEKSFRSLDEDGFRIFFWYLNTCSYRDKYGNILLESKMLAQFEDIDEQNTQAEKFMIRFNELCLTRVGGHLKYTDYNPEEHRCRAVEAFHMGMLHDEFLRLWNSDDNWPKDSINSKKLVFASTGKVATYKALKKRRKQELDEAMSRPCGALTTELLEYLNGDSLSTQVYTELINRNWQDAYNACLQIKDKVLREQQLHLLREIKQNPRAYYFPSFWGLTPRVFTHGGIPELKRELRIILCDGWHDADLVSSQLAICASLWKLDRIEKFLESEGNVWDEIQNTLNIPQEIWDKFKPYVKESLYTICYGGGKWMIKEPLLDGIRTLGLNFKHKKILNHWIFRELKNGQIRAAAKIKSDGGMYDAEEKWLPVTTERKISSIMAEVAQSYELRILISVIRLAKQTGNKLFKVTVWQHDGFSMYIERDSEKVRKMIQETVRKELNGLGIQTKLEFKRNEKKGKNGLSIEKRKKTRRYKKRRRNKKCSPFVSHYNNITEKNLGHEEKPSQNSGNLIQQDIVQSKNTDSVVMAIITDNITKEPATQSETPHHTSDSRGLGTDGRVDTADLRLTA